MLSSALDTVDLIANPQPRCACVLLLDNSRSASEGKIDSLNRGIAEFLQSMNGDALAKFRTELAIITYGNAAEIVQRFAVTDEIEPPTLTANGDSDIAGGVRLALRYIEERKQQYKASSIEYFRPWLFLISSGNYAGPERDFRAAAHTLKRADTYRQVAAFTVGIDDSADLSVLAGMSNRSPVRLKGLDFAKMFAWLSESMSQVSRSRSDEDLSLNPDAVFGEKGWATTT